MTASCSLCREPCGNQQGTDRDAREQYSDFGVLHTEIPKAVRFQDASLNGVSIFKEDKHGKGSQAFETLVQEIMDMEEKKA